MFDRHCVSVRIFFQRLGGASLGGIALLVLCSSFGGLFTARAQVTGTSYTLAPTASRVAWSDDAGLADGYLYGGQLGFGFGEYLELSGLYLLGRDVETRFGGFSSDVFGEGFEEPDAALEALAGLAARDADVTRYGGRLRFNVGRSQFVPFVTLGSGIIRFEVDGLDASEHIYLDAGVGLTYSPLDRLTLSAAYENLAYRYTPDAFLTDEDLAAAGLARGDFEEQTVINPALSLAARFYLGGRGSGELTDIDRALLRQLGGGGLRLAVEPFYGRIRFNDDLQGVFPDDQSVAGVEAGFDFGPRVGVRGFYWRGLNDADGLDTDLEDAFNGMHFYGGLLALRFADVGRDLTPYLSIGGGYMDVDEGAFDDDMLEVAPSDRYFAQAGAGIELALSSALRIQGGVRSLFFSTQEVESLSDPNNVFANLMYTAGVSFNLGRSGRTVGDVVGREIATTRTEARTREEMLRTELSGIRAELDSIRTAQQEQSERIARLDAARAAVPADTAVLPVPAVPDTVMPPAARRPMRPARPERDARFLTVPVPEEGEIYIRFGSVGADTLRPAVRPTVPPRPDTMGAAVYTEDQVRRLIDEALERRRATDTTRVVMPGVDVDVDVPPAPMTDDGEDAEDGDKGDDGADDEAEELSVVQEGRIDVTPGAVEADGTEAFEEDVREPENVSVVPRDVAPGAGRQVAAFRTMTGARVGEGPDQFIVGVRADLRTPGQRLRFTPELGFGFGAGDGVSLNLIGNAVLPLTGARLPVQPYLGLGLGLVTDDGLRGADLVSNVLAGAEYVFPNAVGIYAEYSTLDFFDYNRLLAGVRYTF